MASRQEDVRAAVARWTAQGGTVAMLTLTMRHRLRDRLVKLWGGLSRAWGSVTSGRAWQAEKLAHGVAGWLRVVESTHGAHGWHLHVHTLLFLESEPSLVDVASWKAAIFERWNGSLRRAGMRPASIAAQEFHVATGQRDVLAEYFTKAVDFGDAIAREFTQSASKRSRAAAGGRTPWEVLDSAIATGDADELDLWHEWETASSGKRQMTWSKGLRDRLALGEEQTDEAIADEEIGDRHDDRVRIPAEAWKLMCRSPELAPLALDTLETGGIQATISFLRSAGIAAEWIDASGTVDSARGDP